MTCKSRMLFSNFKELLITQNYARIHTCSVLLTDYIEVMASGSISYLPVIRIIMNLHGEKVCLDMLNVPCPSPLAYA